MDLILLSLNLKAYVQYYGIIFIKKKILGLNLIEHYGII